MPPFLLPEEPVRDLDAYLAAGGGEGIERAVEIGPEATIEEVRSSGLRGRGGAGFPTGIKWAGLRADPSPTKFVVGNGAEGEPGTYKDRLLMERNPYQVVEGLLISAFAVGAAGAYLAVKRSFAAAGEAIKRAVAEMSTAGLAGDLGIGVVEGPEDYLYGEEKALLEVIEGNDPLPRLYPPYVQGLYADRNQSNPAVVNNVETLSNVPHILRHGADWYRSMGTAESPGTMVMTVSGDVLREAVVELELGTPLSFLAYGPGGGVAAGRRVKAVVSGVSSQPLPVTLLDTPLSFEGMKAAGSGLGSAGMIVYDDTACMARVGLVLSRFLNEESCGQCPPCKLGTGELARILDVFVADRGVPGDLDEMAAWSFRVTDANRCGLGAGQQALVEGIRTHFLEDLVHHVAESADDVPPGCPHPREIRLPKIVGYDEAAGKFEYEDEV